MQNINCEAGDKLTANLKWRQCAEKLGFVDFVSSEDGFKSVGGVKWQNAGSSGIYFWIAEDGEAYVGQAKKVRNRLLQHWKFHRDILAAAFQKVPEENLDLVERDMIREVGKLYPTRNIKFAIETVACVPFDKFVSEGVRKSFLSGRRIQDSGEWLDLPILSQKQAKKFARFEKLPFQKEILECLRSYVEACIARPEHTENRFWSVTLFPQNGSYLRVNAGQQEVFTILDGGTNGLIARPLAITDLRDKNRDGPHYVTNSYAYFVPTKEFVNWLDANRVLACRELALWLMRHTTPLNNGSHCPQVVRAAFSGPRFGPKVPRLK